MKADVVTQFLKHLNAKNIQNTGQWIRASCPLAPWKHTSGHDHNPSFGIKIEPVKPSYFNCWACNTGGPLELLLMELMHLLKGDPNPLIELQDAFKLVDADEVTGFHISNWSEFDVHEVKDKFMAWPESYLDSFPTALNVPLAAKYLVGRNVGPAMIKEFDARFDISRGTVTFPFRNYNGKLAGMRGRYLSPTVDLRYHDYDWWLDKVTKVNNTKHVWFNEHRIDWDRTIVLSEGAFDVIAIYQQYQNVMSPLSTGMSFEKIDRLKQAIKIICFFDNDLAGDTATEKIRKAVGTSTVVQKITYPPGTPTGFDASDVGPDVVAEMLKSQGLKLNPIQPI